RVQVQQIEVRYKSMKTKAVFVILCIEICALAVNAQAQKKWRLSSDLMINNNQISFNQGARGVWYFLRSTSLEHKPKTYQFLSAYYEPCVSDSVSTFADGMASWQNAQLARDIYRIPLVEVNFTYITQFPNGLCVILPLSLFIHPTNNEL